MDRIVYEEDDHRNKKPRFLGASISNASFIEPTGDNEFREPMKVSLGQFYHNKTRRYLVPLLKRYGKAAWSKIISMPTLAWGVTDLSYQKEKGKCFDNHLFALVDMETSKDYFFDISPFILSWLKDQDFVIDIYDYVVDGVTLAMVVFELDPIFDGSVKKLLDSDYYSLYNNPSIKYVEQYISPYIVVDNKQYFNPAYGVVTEDARQKEFFAELVRDRFNVKLSDEQIVGYEFTVNKSQEMFNYDKTDYHSFIFDECLE